MKKSAGPDRFQTHIAEPRWQQIISVTFVILLAAGWIYLVFVHK